MITKSELISLKFYQGSLTENINQYYSTQHAYVTLNALMFDGIDNEMSRVKEGKKLKKIIIENIEETINVYYNIFTIMKKCSVENESYNVYRAERKQAADLLIKECRTISLFSTTKNIVPDLDFQKKDGLVLFNIHIPAQMSVIDFEKIFNSSDLYYEQKEVLIPPFLNFNIEQVPIGKDELFFSDINGNPPLEKYNIRILKPFFENITDLETVRRILFDKNKKINAVKAISIINNAENLVDRDILSNYIEWKKYFQKYIYYLFKKIVLN